MSKKKGPEGLDKRDKQIRRLYALIWFLACPLAYVVALLLKFEQINVVYWTLLVVPVLLGIYRVHALPPVKESSRTASAAGPEQDESAQEQREEGPEQAVSRAQWLRLLAGALKIPFLLALPILITLLVHLAAA